MEKFEANKVFYKICFFRANAREPEIRMFATQVPTYDCLVNKICEMFPNIWQGQTPVIYWKDEEGDEVAVSSTEELRIAHASMKSDPKKFIVREGAGKRNASVHPNIQCDVCEGAVVGFRYKCILCSNYDLCATCEASGFHPDHPMLRIPDPALFKYDTLQKIIHKVESFLWRDGHRDRKHCHDTAWTADGSPEPHKKHRKCDRRESADTDESEDGCHRKHSHSHKKLRKAKCPYSQMMSEVFTYLAPKQCQARASSQGWPENGGEETSLESGAKYLRSVGLTLQKFLDPFGVEMDFEVRTNGAKKEEKKKKEEAEEEKASPGGTPAGPQPPSPKASSGQKEVRFADPQEVTKEKVDEISRLLANQTMNGSGNGGRGSVDNDGWVEFEELAREGEDPRPSGSAGAIPKVPQHQDKPGAEKTAPETANKPPTNETLYPSLSGSQLPADPAVRSALEKMLSMGFSNEGNWLAQLLEAKRGNINEALEVLDPHSKSHPNGR